MRRTAPLLTAAAIACAPTYPDWGGRPPTPEWCAEADSIVAAGPDTTYPYAQALSSRTTCHNDGWVRLAGIWHDSRTVTDSNFLLLLRQASRGEIERPTLDTMLSIAVSPTASAEAREAAFRELLEWRMPGIFVNDSAIGPGPGDPAGCKTNFGTWGIHDPAPRKVARRMDQILVALAGDSSVPHLRRVSTCYLEFIYQIHDDHPSEAVLTWARANGVRKIEDE